MIVLDTNVLSEPLKNEPDTRVLRWLTTVAEETSVTAISVGELLVGAGKLPPGRRKDGLRAAIDALLTIHSGNVLPYDESAARAYAALQESRRRAGLPLSVEDGMIAAICLTRGASLATRNVRDFAGIELTVINPWEAF